MRGRYTVQPPETVHEVLLVERAGRRPAPVPDHAVRSGRRGGRSNLRAHSSADDSDVAAHPRVMYARSVTDRNTGTILASTLEAGIPATGAVQAKCLPMGLTLPPDASSSCRGGDRADTSLSLRYVGWGLQNAPAEANFEIRRRPNHPVLATKRADTSPDWSGFVHVGRWESALK